MPNYFPQREIEGKITLLDSIGQQELPKVADECVLLLSEGSTSVSAIMSIYDRLVHRFGGEKRFRVQQESPITLKIGGEAITYPVWGALFKDGQGTIGDIELKIYIASHHAPEQLGHYFATQQYGMPSHLGHYKKSKVGYDITTKTGRTFHVCTDQCVIPGIRTISPLNQIEVEYKESSSTIIPETLGAIQREIATIIGILSAGLKRSHTVGGPKKGRWFSEVLKR